MPMGLAEVVDEAIREHPVRETRLATRPRACTVKGRLHRRGRDSVRVRDLDLERQDDRERDGERQDPVQSDADRMGQALREPIDGVPHPLQGRRERRG